MWRPFLVLCVSSVADCVLTNSCEFQNCRWSIVRESEDSTKVIVKDNSEHSINWQWDVKNGSWNVSYSYKYPMEWYSCKAVFLRKNTGTSSEENASVSWGSSVPWMSNAVPIPDATPWNITYNGDIFGFIPTINGRYIFRVFTTKTTCEVFYESRGLTQVKVVTWEIDEVNQSVLYACNSVRIFENAWQIALSPAETWGFTPTGSGFWVFQHFSRNLIFQPFQEIRGPIVYTNVGAPNQLLYQPYGAPTSGLNMSYVTYTAPLNVLKGT